MAKTTVSQSAMRGGKIERATGVDTSSYGDRGTKQIQNSRIKGSVNDLSHSISNGSVPND